MRVIIVKAICVLNAEQAVPVRSVLRLQRGMCNTWHSVLRRVRQKCLIC